MLLAGADVEGTVAGPITSDCHSVVKIVLNSQLSNDSNGLRQRLHNYTFKNFKNMETPRTFGVQCCSKFYNVYALLRKSGFTNVQCLVRILHVFSASTKAQSPAEVQHLICFNL